MQTRVSPQETNKRAARQVFDVWDGSKDLSALDEIMDEDVVLRGYPKEMRGVSHGRDAYKDGVRMIRSAFPDLFFRAEEVVAEGDKVAAFAMHGGTHTGKLMHMEPTGESFEAADFVIYRFEDEKLVEVISLPDVFGMLVQLGIVNMPGT